MDTCSLHQEQKLSHSPANAQIIKQQAYYSNSVTQTHHKYHINGYLILTRALPHPQHVREVLPWSYTTESLQLLGSCSLGCLSPAFANMSYQPLGEYQTWLYHPKSPWLRGLYTSVLLSSKHSFLSISAQYAHVATGEGDCTCRCPVLWRHENTGKSPLPFWCQDVEKTNASKIKPKTQCYWPMEYISIFKQPMSRGKMGGLEREHWQLMWGSTMESR